MLKYAYDYIEYAVSVGMGTHFDQLWIMRCRIYYVKSWYGASTAGSNFDSENVKVKDATLYCTGNLDKKSLFSNKITSRVDPYSAKYEGLGGIIGGSRT